MTIEVGRGDVVLVAFPFVAEGQIQQKRRPAFVVQPNRYNRGRSAVIIAAITSTRAHSHLPCKLLVEKTSTEGRSAGLKLDSVVDCQTLATVPKDELVRRLGKFPDAFMWRADQALADALGLSPLEGW